MLINLQRVRHGVDHPINQDQSVIMYAEFQQQNLIFHVLQTKLLFSAHKYINCPPPKEKIKYLHPALHQHSGRCVTLISHDVIQLSSALNFSIPTRSPSGTDVGRHQRGIVRR